MDSIIGDTHPNDGRDWEVQCARCGSSVYAVEHFDGRREKFCSSSPEWCKANPMEGRERILRGPLEWFCVERKAS